MNKNYVCKRRDCKFYNKFKDNNCVALSKLYENNMDCKFYKKGSPVKEEKYYED